MREALKLALEALDNLLYWDNGKPEYDEAREAITAIKEALAQPEQKQLVGEVSKAEFGDYPVICWRTDYVAKIGDKFYTTPPQRKPLTDEEIASIVREASKGSAIRRDGSTSHRIARAIEAAHGIKE